ncbi:MAG: lytic transglycosylase domain-containing protein [Leptospiraceae bacterium]|nr:lytic transglycosylase domain-containing protein [Leptospiraceae bacterium]
MVEKNFLIILLLFIFGHFPVFGNEEMYFLVKSKQWKKIENIFKNSSPRTESEFFALARFHEESSSGDRDKKFRLYSSIATGKQVDFVTEHTLQTILDNPMPGQSPVIRLTFWKLYHEFNSRKMLSKNNKLIFLEKFAKEDDPICLDAFEEILKVLYESENYQSVIQKVDELSTQEKRILLTSQVKQRYAQSLFRNSSKKRAIDTWISIISDPNCPDYIRLNVYSDLKFYLKDSIYEDLDSVELSFILSKLSQKESKLLYGKNKIILNRKYENPVSVKNIIKFLVKNQPSQISNFLKIHSDFTEKEQIFLSEIIEILFANKEIHISEDLLKKYIRETFPLSAQKTFIRLYFKKHLEEKFLHTLISYLKENPYDLGFQDKLIDFLIGKTSANTYYAKKEYWEKAILSIPNLPVKGRLMYWYFRFLKDTNDYKTLLSYLENFYEHCPGSYYVHTIQEEFKKEIEQIAKPANPLTNKKNLLKFLSLTPQRDYALTLQNKDLSFAYDINSFELGTRLNNSINQINNHRLLNLSRDYLKIGEEKRGVWLASKYFNSNNLGEEDRALLYVGLGDLSFNSYLSIFYTRVLMKKNKIPDDPILLPSAILSRLYPRPHRNIVQKFSDTYQVSEDIVYAVMRQESFFRESAISVSNAQGLMQVIPSTGKFLAKALNEKDYSLFDPNISVKFGTKFLSDLLKMNEGDIRWATIAYNGGPGNLRKWKRNHYKGDFNHFLEEIPSKESRDYCRIVVSNYYNYRLLKEIFDR